MWAMGSSSNNAIATQVEVGRVNRIDSSRGCELCERQLITVEVKQDCPNGTQSDGSANRVNDCNGSGTAVATMTMEVEA